MATHTVSRRSVNRGTTRFNFAFLFSLVLVLVAPALITAYFGISIHTVMSGSMKPTMNPGDELIADVIPANHVQVGDVILYLNPENWEMTAHRVVKKTQDGQGIKLVMQGDANSTPDPEVAYSGLQPIRQVVYTIPKIGYVLDLLSSTVMKTLGGVLLILINIFFFMKMRRKEVTVAIAPTGRIMSRDGLGEAPRLSEKERLQMMDRFTQY